MADPSPMQPSAAPKRRPFPRHRVVMTAQAGKAQEQVPPKVEDSDPSSSGNEGECHKVARTSGVPRETPRTTYGISFGDSQRRITEGTTSITFDEGRRSQISSVTGERGLDGILDIDDCDEGIMAPLPILADIPEQATAAGPLILDGVPRLTEKRSRRPNFSQLRRNADGERCGPSRIMEMQAHPMDEGCVFDDGVPNLGMDPMCGGLPSESHDVLADVLATVMTPRSTKVARRGNGAAGSSTDLIVIDDGEEGDEEDVELLDDMLDTELTDAMLRQEVQPEPRGPAQVLPANNAQWASFNPHAPVAQAAPVPAMTPVLAAPVVAQVMLDVDSGVSDEDEDEDEMMDRIAPLLRARHEGGLPAASSTDTFEDWCFEFTCGRSVEHRELDRTSIHRWPSTGASQAKIEQKKAAQAAAAAQAAEARAAVAALPGPQSDSPEPDGTSNPTLGFARRKFGNLPFRPRNREQGHRRVGYGDQRMPHTEFQRSSATPTTVTNLSTMSSSVGWTARSISPGDDMNEALEIESAATMPVHHSGPIVSRTSTAGGDAASAAAVFQTFAADAAARAAAAETDATCRSTPPDGALTFGVANAALFAGTGTLSQVFQLAAVNGEVLNGDVSRSLRRAARCARTTGVSSSGSS